LTGSIRCLVGALGIVVCWRSRWTGVSVRSMMLLHVMSWEGLCPKLVVGPSRGSRWFQWKTSQDIQKSWNGESKRGEQGEMLENNDQSSSSSGGGPIQITIWVVTVPERIEDRRASIVASSDILTTERTGQGVSSRYQKEKVPETERILWQGARKGEVGGILLNGKTRKNGS
jgi:hypothetical protein